MSFESRRRKLVLRQPRVRKRFPALGQRLMKEIADLSIKLRAFQCSINLDASEYARDLFPRFSLGMQRKILKSFLEYRETVDEMIRNGGDPRNSLQFTWAYLKRRKLHPTSETFIYLGSDDLIEIYNREYTQIFRSLNFFDQYQIPLFDLLVLDRMTVLRADSKLEEKIFFQMEGGFKSAPRARVFEVSPHESFERLSADQRSYWVEFRHRSPLVSRSRKPGHIEALLVTSRVMPSSSGLEMAS